MNAVGSKLTRIPAIVVTVRNQLDSVPYGQSLPTQLEGFPVDGPRRALLDLMRTDDRALRSPPLDGPFRISSPHLPLRARCRLLLPLSASFGPDRWRPRPHKGTDRLPPGPNTPLDRAPGRDGAYLPRGPDAAWMTLKAFFNQINSRLTVGMYDFTARHILDELLAQLKRSGAPLTLTLDHPPKNPTADQTTKRRKLI